MNNAETMQVLDCQYQLNQKSFHLLLGECKVFSLQVVEHVLALHVLHHDEIVLAVLKEVKKFYYVVVLAHFQYFDFSSLLGNLDG